jgi:hypothetical protein
MKQWLHYLVLTSPLLIALTCGGRSAPAEAPHRLDADSISAAAKTKATTTPDGVVRLGWARTDVAVKVDGMSLKPFAGLGSWAAFTVAPHGAMVMGDTVVFQDEVTPAMDAAFAGGLEVTALHNHFFYDEPKVYFMHIGGRGEPEKLAAGVKAVWDAIKKVRAADATPDVGFGESRGNWPPLLRACGMPSRRYVPTVLSPRSASLAKCPPQARSTLPPSRRLSGTRVRPSRVSSR